MRHRKTRSWMLDNFRAEQRMNYFVNYLSLDNKLDYLQIIRRMRSQLHNWNADRCCTHVHFEIDMNVYHKEVINDEGRYVYMFRYKKYSG